MPVNNQHPLIVAIDGPAGAGKSTVASAVAAELGLPYLDTGAMYRAIGLLALRCDIVPPFDDEDVAKLTELCAGKHLRVEAADGATRVLLDDEDVSAEIRAPRCSEMASAVSAVSAVRRALVPLQQFIGRQGGGVMEGRDIGTVVFPDADLKIFLTASENERARRRHNDLVGSGIDAEFDDVLEQQKARDERDSTREDSPLAVASGARILDTTGMSLDEVVAAVLEELENSLDSTGQENVRSRNY